MSLPGTIKRLANRGLCPLNMRIESLAAERAEWNRLERLVERGQFDGPILPVRGSFRRCNPQAHLNSVRRHSHDLGRFSEAGCESGYRFANNYFNYPDAEVACALVRGLNPSRLIEVGSGNITWLFRSAIADGDLVGRASSLWLRKN